MRRRLAHQRRDGGWASGDRHQPALAGRAAPRHRRSVHRYIKAVGAGQKRARDLTREEARLAMGLVADGEARPEQVGAFLLALRMKGEGGEELAGFVEALHAR